MGTSKLATLNYQDDKISITAYSDSILFDPQNGGAICAIRFGGYPEEVRAMADAIYGGGKISVDIPGNPSLEMRGLFKQYRRDLSYMGTYAEATMIYKEAVKAIAAGNDGNEQETMKQEHAYLFCRDAGPAALFEELDRYTAVPLIPEFRNYLIDKLIQARFLRRLDAYSPKSKICGWYLCHGKDDKNIIEIIESGLRTGELFIPGEHRTGNAFQNIHSVTDYLNTFGVTVAKRIQNMFTPLFNPETDSISNQVMAVNEGIQRKCGYSLYDAQLAVIESIKRRLDRSKIALLVAECGSGKTKMGAAAIAAHQLGKGQGKTFNIVLCPSHVAKKWVREIEETVPNSFAMIAKNITGFERVMSLFKVGGKSAYVIISKETARDGYMRAPAVKWSKVKKAFVCPQCGKNIEMIDGGDRINADQFFFLRESRNNHKCEFCGSPLWTCLNSDHVPRRPNEWIKIGDYGFVHRYTAFRHLDRCKKSSVYIKLKEIAAHPDGIYPAVGAYRKYPLSTYIKKCYRGQIASLNADELHQYAKNSGQGDAMGELIAASKKVVGMTATLINGYSSGIFHLLYRICPHLMVQDGQKHSAPSVFDKEYGVIEEHYEVKDANFNANRRTAKPLRSVRQKPGVSPLVYSRFLLEYAAFLSLSDMGKDLPEYEEIPIPVPMSPAVEAEYQRLERTLKNIMKNEKRIAKKILSAYLNILLAYPDQPYGHEPILNPLTGKPLIRPNDACSPDELHEKYRVLFQIAKQKIDAGEHVLFYTSWVRLDSQKKLQRLLQEDGYSCEILNARVNPEKREEWVQKRLENGMQAMIANPACVETGLDLNAFTTIIFFDTGTNLFTFRQASRRSYRINQIAPRIEVYIPYFINTMQQRMVKLMASKLAVAGILEGHFSEEGVRPDRALLEAV